MAFPESGLVTYTLWVSVSTAIDVGCPPTRISGSFVSVIPFITDTDHESKLATYTVSVRGAIAMDTG